ncbi:CPBP family intramembrane glutamic endopeptidase [Pseudoalteromonas sp. MMG022]|uniref:CPBP family intramembrane glutamic endopeptidase n=1 Tax=Pseudoalteromonas sp. MMG022 TaxID=2909978 RepID=UPI001F48DABA|nr:CPBP family intramembrane glutamic endopeptidase [Pseudoalteromonas sp. MMG022]MCF6437219.1 CPBP family intramembrane metalloprotease [Pseudoalteromonas sp. MMG022]
MDMLKHFIKSSPAMASIIITFFSVGLLFVAKAFEADPNPLFNWPRLAVLTLISLAVIHLLKALKWQTKAGLMLPIPLWQGRWLLASIPLLLIALLSLTSVSWQAVEYSPIRLFAWLTSNFATGFFEEVLMRGLCFYMLLRKWGSTQKGVFLAVLFQAFIFGAAHLANLYHMPMIDVIAQVIFATLIGIGFAGLVYLSKSLWPAIIVHTAINSFGTINDFFVTNSQGFESPGVTAYVIIVALFLVLSTIPGLFYLRAGTSRLPAAQV